MTLFRQILVVILVSLVVNLIGVLWLSFDSTKDYLSHQLESDLDNTSTSLGMSLLPFIEQKDNVMIESTMKAYFDSGYYQKISVTLLDTNEVISHEVSRQINSVPQWFVDIAVIRIPSNKSTLTSGWLQVAEVEIVGHPGFAYAQLWKTFINYLSWFAGLTLVVVFIAAVGIKQILSPLNRIRQKAKAIQQQQFGEPIPLPNTLELRSLVNAVNVMSDRIQTQFQQDADLHNRLKEQAFQDATTGFGNRAFLNRQIEAWLREGADGYVVFVSITGLEDIKQKLGFQKRDELVQQVAHYITQCTEKVSECVRCRISANEFAMVLPGVDNAQCKQLTKQLAGYLAHPSFVEHFELEMPFFIGATQSDENLSVSDVMSAVDAALLRAKSSSNHTYVESTEALSKHHLKRETIKQSILNAIEESNIEFVRQPVNCFGDTVELLHYEVFAKLHVEQGDDIPASSFISVLDEYDLGTSFDKKVVELTLARLNESQAAGYAVNLSASALNSQAFIHWLIDILKQAKNKQKISIEFSEESVIYNKDNIQLLVTALRQLNVSFGIDRVARNFSSLSYLKEVQPDYVKIDPVFTQMAIANDSDAYFVTSLCAAIHNLNIKIVASHVESEVQLSKIQSIQFDGYQGFIHKPEHF